MRRLTGGGAAALVLALFWVLMMAAAARKSLTTDEIVHATAGHTYWTRNDYRLNPENGNLPQRWMALPLLGGAFPFPPAGEAWRGADEWALGDLWFHHEGNRVESMLRRGRAVCALLAVALAAVVWLCARRLFGPAGGMVALLACVLNPTILANGPLMTSDIACGLFFLAATAAWWALLERPSPGRFLLSAGAAAALFLSKMSAPLFIVIAVILAAAQLARRPAWGRVAALAAAQSLVVYAAVWAGFGFRYSAFAGPGHFNDTWEHLSDRPLLPELLPRLALSPGQAAEVRRRMVAERVPANKWTWEAVAFVPEIERDILQPPQTARLEALLHGPPGAAVPRALDWMRRRALLPEAYLFGQAYSWKFAQKRGSFAAGRYGIFGWWWFFPYTVLLKTPLPFFGLVLLAALALARLPRDRWFDCLPYLVLMAVYWAALIPSHINIGHRHILATYPPLFVLAGAAALLGGWLRRAAGGLLVLLAADVLGAFPDYLAYMNLFGGGPRHAYEHLVDSSLDWGQDLPAVNPYLAEHGNGGRAYLSYFGTASPDYYHVRAQLLYALARPAEYFTFPTPGASAGLAELLRAHADSEVIASGAANGQTGVMLMQKPDAFRLQPGTYIISATMLQPMEYDPPGPWGPWDERDERTYQSLLPLAQPFLSGDAAARMSALQQASVYEWMDILDRFDQYRFARLTAYLRHRGADDAIGGGSLLVFRLSAEDLARAFGGPAPERGPDVLADLARQRGEAAITTP